MRYHALTVELIHTAAQKARSLGHSYVGSEHLLLAMAESGGGMGLVLRQAGLDPGLTQALAQLLYGAGTADLPLPQGLTREARGILRCAAREARLSGSRQVWPQHLLLSIARREHCAAGELLRLNGVSADVLFTDTLDYLRWEHSALGSGKKEAVTTKLLEQFSEDLVAKAAAMEPVIGRDKEIDMVIGILCRKNKNNPALVGQPGVGKTAIAEGLAQRMALGNVPPQIRDLSLIHI